MFNVVKNIITSDDCNEIYKMFTTSNLKKDNQVRQSDILYDSELGLYYLNKLKSFAETFFEKKLKGVRVYIRKSYKGNVLQKHKDTTQYVISVLIKQEGNEINPLYIYSDTKKNSIILNEGDGVIFCGSKYEHERPPIISDFIIGMYLGYEDDTITKNFL